MFEDFSNFLIAFLIIFLLIFGLFGSSFENFQKAEEYQFKLYEQKIELLENINDLLEENSLNLKENI